MKQFVKNGLVMGCVLALFTGCGNQNNTVTNDSIADNTSQTTQTTESSATVNTETQQTVSESLTMETIEKKTFENAKVIELSDEMITVDGNEISKDTSSGIYAANDIVFYLADQGFTYGEGTAEDEHTQEEADTHTVVHITEPGTYAISGKLSAGQIAVDLGEDAENDPEAVVTLILNGVDIECSVAPAIIFYNVYECGNSNVETATNTVDTTAAGANVMIADNTVNNISGSYVARIYESYELSEDGTEVIDNKKLHKYDAAFYSKKSMNVNGDEEGTGILNIVAENEGLDSELHLTINGGNINITSGNDGINTNEDEVSVTTINGGTLTIQVTGETGEGDGIDSNGWLVINGGTVIAEACSTSGDAGIDSDMGIHINGGMVIATGNMLDRISESEQNYAVFSFASRQSGKETYILKNEAGEIVMEYTPENDFTYLILSSDNLTANTYTLWQGDTQLAAIKGDINTGMPGGFPGGQMLEGMEIPEEIEIPEGMPFMEDMEIPERATPMERPEGMERPEDITPPENMEIPEGMTPPENMEVPEGMESQEAMQMPENGERPEGGRGNRQNGSGMINNAELSIEFNITENDNYFNNVSIPETSNE